MCPQTPPGAWSGALEEAVVGKVHRSEDAAEMSLSRPAPQPSGDPQNERRRLTFFSLPRQNLTRPWPRTRTEDPWQRKFMGRGMKTLDSDLTRGERTCLRAKGRAMGRWRLRPDGGGGGGWVEVVGWKGGRKLGRDSCGCRK
ncbi:hypothetical protein VC83_02852 [Pseudogymnoascus destructans]|uniref:Uncharacterized protein n=1 Tax=Pseudogymnoascus destructans TaxID=655981 RepID=A0A177AFB4_9PEZI|nr:uncharacterized protein VC83_02852 [Pseudogymnoascus destructans]OAF60102.1 hypothetical protein VC83_02852 [Pseudogymnoascus destructans]